MVFVSWPTTSRWTTCAPRPIWRSTGSACGWRRRSTAKCRCAPSPRPSPPARPRNSSTKPWRSAACPMERWIWTFWSPSASATVSLHGKRLWDRYPAFAMSEETFAAFPYRLMSYDTLAGYEAIHIKLCIRTESPLLNSLNDRIEAIDPNLLEHYAAGAAVGFWLSNFGTVDGLVSPLASLRSPGYHPVNWQWQERPWCYTFF